MKSIEMTSGSLWKNILLFSLPLMLTPVSYTHLTLPTKLEV